MYFNKFYRSYGERIVRLEGVCILGCSLLFTQQVPIQASCFID